MSAIDFNKGEDYISEIKIFNEGVAGVVGPVQLKITRKGPDDNPKSPDYKLFAVNESGEINEGFYYYESSEDKGFKNFQAQKLIMLARGVLGDDVKFPAFTTPREALDQIMQMVAKAVKGKSYRIVCTYGTTKRPEMYLGFKNFGRFVQPWDEDNLLTLEVSDNTVRATKKNEPTSEDLIKSSMNTNSEPDYFAESPVPTPEGAEDDLPF